jgi:hypothetical protein
MQLLIDFILFLSIFSLTSHANDDPCKQHPDFVNIFAVQGNNNFDFGYNIGKATSFLIRSRQQSNEYQAIKAYSETTTGAALVAQFASNANRSFPLYWSELEGMAKGAGLTVLDLFLFNLFDELETAMPAQISEKVRSPHCSDILVGAPNGASTPRYIAHNEDANAANMFLMYLLDGQIPRLDGSGLLEFTAYMYPGQLPTGAFAYTSSGLFFTLNGLFPLSINTKGVPRCFLHRYILESISIDDAIYRAVNQSVGEGFSVNIGALNDTRLVNVETSAVDIATTVFTNSSQVYFHTNSYRHSTTPQNTDESSVARLERMMDLPLPSPLNASSAYEILGDNLNKTYPIYRLGIAPDCCMTVVSIRMSVQIDENGSEFGIFELFPNNPKFCPEPLLVRHFTSTP